MKTYHFEKYGNTYQMQLRIASYYTTGNLAIELYCWSEEENDWSPWNTLTVNPDFCVEKNCAYIDVNNNGKLILDWLKKNRLARSMGSSMSSGYCIYPKYRFFKKALREADSEGYERYLRELEEEKE